MTAARDHLDQDSAAGSTKIWDPVVRVFHWGLAAAVFIALMFDEDRALHEAAGYAALVLVLVRVLWGFLGPRHARFSSFVRSPGAVLAYLKEVAGLRARRYLGHNPAGGAMILLLLAMVATAGISGWLSETDRFFPFAADLVARSSSGVSRTRRVSAFALPFGGGEPPKLKRRKKIQEPHPCAPRTQRVRHPTTTSDQNMAS